MSGDSFEAYNPASKQAGEEPLHRVKLAGEIASRPVVTVAVGTTLPDAVQAIFDHGFRHLPVVSASRELVGMLSERDLLKARAERAGYWRQLRVESTMTRRLVVARRQASIREVAQVIIRYGVGCVPLVDDEGRLDAIITRSDVLGAVANFAPLDLWA